MTDADLVYQTRSGKRSAYETLVHRWSARVLAYVRAKVHNQEVAEDIAQDSLLKAYRSLDSLEVPARFGSWLLSIAHRATVDWLKARARSEVRLGEAFDEKNDVNNAPASSVEQPSAECERRETQSKLLAEIAKLPEPLCEVVMIYYYDRVTYKEMANMLGVSSATINARLTKARKMLRERLCDVDEDSRSFR